MHQIIIIGSGPAGLTAGIYAARAGLEPLLFASSVEPGGELMNTTDVENFPGFPEGIQGPELMEKIQAQAEKFGTKVVYDDVTALDLSGDVKKVTTSDGTVTACYHACSTKPYQPPMRMPAFFTLPITTCCKQPQRSKPMDLH